MKITTRTSLPGVWRAYAISIAFILPSLALLVPFVIVPVVQTLQVSFYEWNGIQAHKTFVGLRNYSLAFQEPRFIKALVNNGIWTVMHILLACGTALFLAYNITRVPAGRSVFRTVLFLPNVIALSVSAVIWGMMYHPSFGAFNQILRAVGLSSLARPWLGEPHLAIYAIAVASAWQAYGYYMVIFLAGLQGVDRALYEAAEIDGAKGAQIFFRITIPALAHVLTFVLSLSIINGLKGFATVWAMTQGGPEYSTYLLTLYIFKKAFTEYKYGLAMVGGVVLALMILVLTILFNRLRERRVTWS